MAIPDHVEKFSDGAIGFATSSGDETMVGFGVATGGTPATMYGPYLRPDDIVADLISGPLVQWGCHQLQVAKGVPIYLCPVTASVAGTSSAVTASGSGPAITLTGTPVDDYSAAQVKIVLGGAVATATFQYTLDGLVWSQTITTAVTYLIPGTGLTLNFAAGTYVAADTYSWKSAAPYGSTTDFGAAYDVADASGVAWKSGAWIGQPGGVSDTANATAFAAVFTAASAKIAASLASHRIRVLILEAPAVNDTLAGDNALFAQTDALNDTSIVCCYSFAKLISPLDKVTYKRSSAWLAASRIRSVGRKVDPSWVALGQLPNASTPTFVSGIYHDENKRSGPDAHRFVTLRTFEGLPGYYLTNVWLFSTAGSDYRYIQHRRVINDAARMCRAAMLQLVSGNVRTYQSPPPSGKVAGAILEEDALSIEGNVNDLLLREITGKGDAQKCWIEVTRTNAILTDQTLKYRLRVRMPGYIKTISMDAGFAV